MSVWRYCNETTSSEHTKWLAFNEIDPDPEIKRQYENASLVATFESVMSGKRVKIKDRLLKYGEQGEHKQSPEEMKAILELHQKAINLRNKQRGKMIEGEPLVKGTRNASTNKRSHNRKHYRP
jgi:tRNA G10  N-methylase Trm11